MAEQDAVMHVGGHDEAGSNGVVIPPDAAQYKDQRAVLGELPMAPPTRNDVDQGDAVMQEAEEMREEVHERMDEGDEDLFGDDDDDEGNDEQQDMQDGTDTAGAAVQADARTSAEPTGDDLPEAELERRRRLEYEEGDEDTAPAVESQKVQYAEVRLPKLPMATEKQKIWHAKLPNFLHLESRPFHPTTWDSKAERENTNVPVENTLRWRWDPSSSSSTNGAADESKPTSSLSTSQPAHKKQSNARIIRWNDGSMSLQLGAEIFDIATDRTVSTNKAAVPSALPSGSTSTSSSSKNPIISSAHSESTTYLVAQHPYAGLLESQATVTGNLTFRPTAIQSSSHRKLASALSGKHVKTSKTVMMMAENDPEHERAAKEQAAKKGGKRAAKATNGESGGSARKPKRKNVRSTRLDDFSDNDFGDEDDGDDAGGAGGADKAAERKNRKAREKAEMDDFLASESDDDDEEGDGDDDDADGTERRGTASSSKKKSRREEEMDVEDDLDEMEARAEQAARAEKKKNKKEKDAKGSLQRPAAAAPPPVDIDSDDLDNDEPAETQVKKRLVIESDEE